LQIAKSTNVHSNSRRQVAQAQILQGTYLLTALILYLAQLLHLVAAELAISLIHGGKWRQRWRRWWFCRRKRNRHSNQVMQGCDGGSNSGSGSSANRPSGGWRWSRSSRSRRNVTNVSGNGGNGVASSITGSSVTRGGGGGGGIDVNGTSAGTGGTGGGGDGGKGGSGVVILRYSDT
jgi:hypothetical protein